MNNHIQPVAPQPVEQPKQNVPAHKSGNNLNWLLVTAALIIIVVMLVNHDRYGETTTADIAIPAFTKVHLQAGPGELVIKQGEVASLTLTAPEKYHQWVSAEVRDDELNIDANFPWFQRLFFVGPKKESIVFTLTITDLNTLTVDGFVDVQSEGVLTQDSLNILINGAADATFALQLQEVGVTLAGAGEINLSGAAVKQRFTIDGAGEIDALSLEGKDVEATINGAGSAEVFATETLAATLNGAGSIQYAGNPTTIKENINGVGSISPVEGDNTNDTGDESDDTEGAEITNTNSAIDESQNANAVNTNGTN